MEPCTECGINATTRGVCDECRSARRGRIAKRVCAQPGCPEITSNTRCATHAREADNKRGSRQQRGYGAEHQRLGDAAIAGATHCGTCGQPFTPDNPVTRGHAKDVRAGGSPSDGYIAQCQRCNYGWRRGASDLRR